MHNRLMRTVALEDATIKIYTFLAPLLKKESDSFVSKVEALASLFRLEHDGAYYRDDKMDMGRLRSRWSITVKGRENAVESFEREARKLE